MSVQPDSRSHHRFNAKRFPFALWRLSNEEYRQLRSQSFPIQFNSLFLLRLALDNRNTPEELTLPKALLVLEDKFGCSSTDIDTWKQTFSFPFLLTIAKPTGVFHYLLRIEDYRGGLEFRLYRVVDDLKYMNEDLEICHQPLVDELTEDEIKYIIGYLWGYLETSAQAFSVFPSEIKPFFRHVDSSHIIYGYWDGKFVEEGIEDPDEYQRRVAELERLYGEPKISETEKVKRTQEILQTIMRSH